jgi:hypothetical protein
VGIGLANTMARLLQYRLTVTALRAKVARPLIGDPYAGCSLSQLTLDEAAVCEDTIFAGIAKLGVHWIARP